MQGLGDKVSFTDQNRRPGNVSGSVKVAANVASF